jgi:hypothetical protein
LRAPPEVIPHIVSVTNSHQQFDRVLFATFRATRNHAGQHLFVMLALSIEGKVSCSQTLALCRQSISRKNRAKVIAVSFGDDMIRGNSQSRYHDSFVADFWIIARASTTLLYS